MPGTGFKQTAKLWKATLIDTVEKPKALVRKQMAEGRGKPSMLSQAFEKAPNMDAEQEDIVKWGSGALYAGGADTVSFDIFLMSCFLGSRLTLADRPLAPWRPSSSSCP